MINLNASLGMSYGTGYDYTAGRIPAGSGLDRQNGQESRLPGAQGQDDRLPKGMGIKDEEDGRNKLKGIGQDEKDQNKLKGIGQDEEDPNKECQTCKNRRYKDGSDEMVSFKTPTHISPESAASAVRAHEQEHVSNAYAKAATNNGKVVSASVSIHTAICPECGRTYISGGTTHTQIKYYNEDNPYQKALKTADQAKYSGMNLDYAV